MLHNSAVSFPIDAGLQNQFCDRVWNIRWNQFPFYLRFFNQIWISQINSSIYGEAFASVRPANNYMLTFTRCNIEKKSSRSQELTNIPLTNEYLNHTQPTVKCTYTDYHHVKNGDTYSIKSSFNIVSPLSWIIGKKIENPKSGWNHWTPFKFCPLSLTSY